MPYPSCNQEPFENPYNSFFTHLLERSHPQYLDKHYDLIYCKKKEIRDLKNKIQNLEQQKANLIGSSEANKKYVASNKYLKKALSEIASNKYLKKKSTPKTKKYFSIVGGTLITIGLIILLFIGIISLLEIEIKDIFESKNILKTVIAFYTAISINIAEKLAFEKQVEYYKETNLESNFNWKLIGMASIIIIIETCFASYGLISLSTSNKIFDKILAVIGASLAATINIMFAWSTGLENTESKKEYLDEYKDQYREIIKDRLNNINIIATNDEKVQELNKRIKASKKELKQKEKKWEKEYEKWQKVINNTIDNKRMKGESIEIKNMYKKYSEAQNNGLDPTESHSVN